MLTLRQAVKYLVAVAAAVTCTVLGYAMGVDRSDLRRPVLVLAHDVLPGQVLESDDLEVVRVASDPTLAAISETRQSGVLGRSVRWPTAAGTLVTEAILGPTDWPPAGRAIVTVTVPRARAPVELDLGAHVLVLPLGASGEGQDRGAAVMGVTASAAPPPLALATVIGVSSPDAVGVQAMSLLVTTENAIRIAPLSTAVALVVVSPTT